MNTDLEDSQNEAQVSNESKFCIIPINELDPNMPINGKFGVVAIILGKTSYKKVTEDKYVMNMTVRDSAFVAINVSLWFQNERTAKRISLRHHIGDTIQLSNVTVKFAQREWYVPPVNSRYYIEFNSPKSSIKSYRLSSLQEIFFNCLRKHPIKDPRYYHTLIEAHENPRIPDNSSIDIIAMIKNITDRSFYDSNDQLVEQIQVSLFDQTCDLMLLMVRDDEFIRLLNSVAPFKYALHITNVTVKSIKFSNVRRLFLGNRSIIIVDPQINEAKILENYAVEYKKKPLSKVFSYSDGLVPDFRFFENISNILSIKNSFESYFQGNDKKFFNVSAIVYGFCTRNDVEELNIESLRCKSCYSKLNEHICLNNFCKDFLNENYLAYPSNKISISDFTGELTNCSVTKEAFDRLYGSLEDLKKLSVQDRTHITWNMVLRPLKIWLYVETISKELKTMKTHILNWKVMSFEEFAKAVPMPPIY